MNGIQYVDSGNLHIRQQVQSNQSAVYILPDPPSLFFLHTILQLLNRTAAMSDPSTALPLPTKGTINSETYGEICIGIGGDDSDTEGVPAASSEQTVGCFTFDDEGYIVPLPFGTS
jgi:hypothetical protein